MASLKDLLNKTILFVAAKDAGKDAFNTCNHAPGDPITFSIPPVRIPVANPEAEPIWHWVHDPAFPAKITSLSAFVRGANMNMRMPVCDRIEVESVTIKVDPTDPPVSLPLTPAYVLVKYALDAGTVNAGATGWWQLPASVDQSILVVFGYELVPSSGAAPRPLSLDSIKRLGDRFFPDPDLPADDPDASDTLMSRAVNEPPAIASVNEVVTANISPTWVIVAFGLSCCKERADFEPGEILGAGRIYPHVMVTCNHAATQVESKIHVVRPSQTMVMDNQPEMLANIGTIFIADTNSAQDLSHSLIGTGPPPLPLWSNFFDYYDLSPPVNTEACFVDRTKTRARTVRGAIIREKSAHLGGLYESSSPFNKVIRQGEFDNIHLAPRMRFSNPATGVTINNIVMAPFCEHDCLHTHTRWGMPGPTLPKSNKGFVGRRPYEADGAPLVPENQSVFVTPTSPSSFRYRAVASGPIQAGTFTVFYHHGSGYSLAIAAPATFKLARFGVQQYVGTMTEPFVRVTGGILTPTRVSIDVDPTDSIAALYQRLQFTGTADPDVWKPRIQILNLALCRRS